MRALVIATRDPGGRQSGRKTVIKTIVASLLALGHEVEVAVLDDGSGVVASLPAGVAVHWLGRVGPARIAANVATRATTGRLSLNECLFSSPAQVRSVRSLAAGGRFDVVIADMLRAFPAAEGSGLPIVLDLDDLLSDRYARLGAADPSGKALLGFYGEGLPAPIAKLAPLVARRLLGIEARLIRRRELVAGRRADVVTLVAEEEAQRFAERCLRPVFAAPMAVPVPTGCRGEPSDLDVVFVGGLDYHPNAEAVRWYIDEVVPELDRLGHSEVRLHVIGHCTDDQRRALGSDRVTLHGYVDDVGIAVRPHAAMVAPLRSGTGVKTKVVEGMASGLPLVATSVAVAGTGAIAGEHCWVADDGAGFAAAIVAALEDRAAAAARADGAQALVMRRFSPQAVADRWREILAEVGPTGARIRPAERIGAVFYNDYPMDKALAQWRRGLYPGQHLFGVTHMDRCGVDIDVLAFGRPGRIRDLLFRFGDPLQQLRVLRRTWSGSADVVYAAGSYNSVLLALLRRAGILRVPLVGTVHHLARGPLRRPWAYRALFGGHDALLCMSAEIHQELVRDLGYPPDRAHLVDWAVDLDLYRATFPPGGAGEPSVVSAGKTKRDFPTLVQALSGEACQVDVYCSAETAPDTTGLEANVSVHYNEADRGQASALTFPELLDRYRACTAVAIPLPASEVHGTTGLTSLLEALAMGRPVLMTRNTFLDVDELGVGTFIEPGDQAGWRAAVRRLRDEPDLAEQMGRRARKLCEERYGLDRYAGRVAEVLRATVAANRRRRGR